MSVTAVIQASGVDAAGWGLVDAGFLECGESRCRQRPHDRH